MYELKIEIDYLPAYVFIVIRKRLVTVTRYEFFKIGIKLQIA